MMYSGKQDIKVMLQTFHKKSYDQINSQSKRNKIKLVLHFNKLFLPKLPNKMLLTKIFMQYCQ